MTFATQPEEAGGEQSRARIVSSAPRIARQFYLVTFGLAFVAGCYAAYFTLFLESVFHRGALIFLVIALNSAFEMVFEPVTGNYADAFGRRRAICRTFECNFVALCALAVTCIFPWHTTTRLVLIIAGELAFALAAAFQSGAHEAWFFDEFRIVGGQERAIPRIFAVREIYRGAGMTVGGAIALAVYQTHGLDRALIIPWLVCGSIVIGLRVFASRLLPEEGFAPTGEWERSAFWTDLMSGLRDFAVERRYVRAMSVCSAWYVGAIVLMYFWTLRDPAPV
jgi:MFS family permease